MNRLKTVTLLMTLTVIALFNLAASDVLARETSGEYNPESGYIVYSVSDGDTGSTYTITTVNIGCVELGTPPDLTGPDDVDSVEVICINAGGLGEAEIQICEGPVCFAIYEFLFRCDSECNKREITGHVPALTLWGIITLVTLLTLTTAFIIRRKRVTAKK